MTKRILSLLMVFFILIGSIPMSVSAATTLNYTPNAKVEYNYSSGVECGTIRYISQNPDSKYFKQAYWPTSALDSYSSPKTECGTACISMALSYVGVNKTPKEILEPYNGVTMFIGWGGTTYSTFSTSEAGISKAFDNYINGNGKYSPPVIHIEPFSATSKTHFVVLAGKIADNQYLVVDPYNDSTWTLKVSGSSAVYYNGTNPITRVCQWYNPNASIAVPSTPADDFIVESHPSYAVVKTPSASPLWSLPCSDKTSTDSVKITTTTAGTSYTVTKVIKNIQNNFWYELKYNG